MTIGIRLWDKELKKMFYLEPMQLDNGIAFLEDEKNFVHLEDEHPVYMLRVGSTDRNQKHIYVGDIVDCIRDNDGNEWVERVIINDIRNLPRALFGSSLVYRAIVGNIYENPELLDQED